jgi:hypothetical protein
MLRLISGNVKGFYKKDVHLKNLHKIFGISVQNITKKGGFHWKIPLG